MNLYYHNEHGSLFHGDCIETMGFLSAFYSSFDMILCDPPYGTTQNKWDSIIPLDEMWANIWSCTKENAAVVITAQTPFDKILGASCIKHLKYEWIWEKSKATGHLNAKKQPMKAHENALVFYTKQCLYNPQKTDGKPYVPGGGCSKKDNYGDFNNTRISGADGKRFPRTVHQFIYETKPVHPTQKPIVLFEYFIKTYTNPGETVLDFCAGSGTTAVAAQNTGRKWICIEKEEKYCELIANRLGV